MGATASGYCSHAEGINTKASSSGSHAEGRDTRASGIYSHAEGYGAIAGQDYSHAEGYYTQTGAIYQHVQGKYNRADSSMAHIVGWGTGTGTSNRKNIHGISKTGSGYFKGDVYVNTDDALTNGKKVATEEYVATSIADLGLGSAAYTNSTDYAEADHTHDYAASTHEHDYMPLIGGEFSGEITTRGINLTNGVDYGTSQPSNTNAGHLFFMLDNTTDRVVSHGLDANTKWYYRKWNSGFAECWKTVSATVQVEDWADSGMLSLGSLGSLIGGGDFGLYWTNSDALKQIQFNFPFAFADRPSEVVNITQASNDGKLTPAFLIAVDATDTTAKTNAYRICTYKKPTVAVNFTLNLYITGMLA